MLLYGKPLAEKLQSELQQKVQHYFPDQKKFVALLFFGENSSSATYVHHKQRFADKIGLPTLCFGQGKEEAESKFFSFLPYLQQKERNQHQIFDLISLLNQDEQCIGIMIQLPLPEKLQAFKNDFVAAIAPEKDIDGLGGTLVGKSFFEYLKFTPATPKAVMSLLDYYELGDLRGKSAVVIGQSTIVGKPLALELLKRGAQLSCFDIRNTPEEIKSACQQADYIFSATGQIQLVDASYLNQKKSQILIDIGYGHKDGKPVGDIDFDSVKDKILHITPVPGGVGPLTIASLFSNVIELWELFHE